jgi:hypothetical protein
VRAEHPSLRTYLRTHLTDAQRERVLLAVFNHWDFGLAAAAETALALRDLGSDVRLALWSGETPMHDEGWGADPRLCRLLGTHSPDQNLMRALVKAGLPQDCSIRPPILRWEPVEDIRIEECLNRSAIRALTYRDTPMGKAMLQVHPDRDTPITDDHRWPRRWLQRSARSYAWTLDQTLAAIRELDITAVVVFNGRFLHDRAVAEAARLAGVPVLSAELGGSDTDFDLTVDSTHDWSALQRRMLRTYDVWDAEDRIALGSSWFEARARHADPRNSLFVEGQQPGAALDIAEASCLVVFFSSSGDEMAELDFDWDEYFGGQGPALQILARVCRELPGTRLVVRSHPHKRIKPRRDVEDWLRDVETAGPDVHLDPYSRIDSYTLMRQADIVVTYGSTTGIEAAYAGKPVIVMGPSAHGEIGAVTTAHNENELRTALQAKQVGNWEAAVAFGLLMRRRGFVVERLERDSEGGYSLEGIRFQDVRPLARHASHLMDRIQRSYLRRR